MSKRSLLYFISKAIVAVASPLVPRWRRREWRETWHGELWHGGAERNAAVVRRSTGAVSHAAWLRISDWSGDGLLQDVRYGVRSLRNQPGFTAVALLVLTLGIGANTTIFSVVNGLLVRPIGGVEDPAQLVGVWRAREGQPPDNWSYPNYLDIRTATEAFSGAAVFARATLTLRQGDSLERLPVQVVSRDYFEVLKVTMLRGSGLDSGAATPDIVLSYGAWQRRFGGRALVGDTIEMNGVPLRVAGIAAPEFLGLARAERPEAWVGADLEVVLGLRPQATLDARGNSWLRMVARLEPGVSMQQARASAVLTTELLGEHGVNRGASLLLAPANGFAPDDADEAGLVLGMLMAVTGLVLLIACANVANLLLARGRTRSHEYGIRIAVGASRGRLVRQHLVESLILSLGAAATGALIAVVGGVVGDPFRDHLRRQLLRRHRTRRTHRRVFDRRSHRQRRCLRPGAGVPRRAPRRRPAHCRRQHGPRPARLLASQHHGHRAGSLVGGGAGGGSAVRTLAASRARHRPRDAHRGVAGGNAAIAGW